uniref:Rho-GAP domain-containing protein n=1 Tax=Pseudonaja textilis TaxID=8673 RepID=A0A670YSV9_PSETE
MPPPIVTLTGCSPFLCPFKQSNSAVRLKGDMKKIAVMPPSRQKGSCHRRRLFGVSLQELQHEGLSKCGIPTVVWDIVEYLSWHGLKQEGLFRVNGNLKTVEQLRMKYEGGDQVDLAAEADVSSAASLLKLFLRELPDRVIPSTLYPKFIQLYEGDGFSSNIHPYCVVCYFYCLFVLNNRYCFRQDRRNYFVETL